MIVLLAAWSLEIMSEDVPAYKIYWTDGWEPDWFFEDELEGARDSETFSSNFWRCVE